MADLISREELQAALDAGKVTLVEALGPAYYEEQHLPGAINIPHTEVEELAPALLRDKHALIVTYCSNTACANSQVAADKLRTIGYTNVRKYAEGKQGWLEAGLPVERGRAAA